MDQSGVSQILRPVYDALERGGYGYKSITLYEIEKQILDCVDIETGEIIEKEEKREPCKM